MSGLEQSTNHLEHDWFTSVHALYAYGEQHAQQIRVKDGKTSISNTTVRDKFDDLLGRNKAMHKKLA